MVDSGCHISETEDDISVAPSDSEPLLSSQRRIQVSIMGGTTNKSNVLPQYCAAFCATLGAFAMGTVIGYSSPAGSILTSNSTEPGSIHLTSTQNSWFSSICNLGALGGSIFGGLCINKFGRRGTMMYSFIPMIFGWSLIVGAKNFLMLLFGRVFTGFSAGLISISVPTYVTEFASPEIRGTLGSSFQLMIVTGVLFTFSLGAAFDSFRAIGALCMVVPVLFVILIYFNKESPIYLLSVNRDEDATNALMYFRGKNYPGIPTELRAMRDSLEESKARKISLSDLKAPYILKPLLMSLCLFFFQQFSGINAVLFNLEIIFAEADTDMSKTMSSIIVGATQVFATLLGTLLMDKAGRKALLAVSASFMIISLFMLGTFFYVKEEMPEKAANIAWIPLVSLVLYIIAFSVGYGPIPWLMMGELFSPDIKEAASSIAATTNWTLAFVTTFLFFPLQRAINDYGVYWMFGSLCFINLIYVITCVYETKGKTLQEINAHFGANRTSQTQKS